MPSFRNYAFLGLAAAALLGGGMAAGGFLAGRGILDFRLADRNVTVKGVAEQEVTAGLATYPLRVTVTAGDIADGERRLTAQIGEITKFLREYGFSDEEIVPQRLEVQDILAQPYRPKDANEQARFILAQAVMLRSEKIDLVTRLSQEAGELVRRGIVLSDTGGPNYIVTASQLNDLKPELIRRATAAARAAAAEFAAASESRVGGIRKANQGVIVILARDEGTPESQSPAKRIRAVTTVDYFLVE